MARRELVVAGFGGGAGRGGVSGVVTRYVIGRSSGIAAGSCGVQWWEVVRHGQKSVPRP